MLLTSRLEVKYTDLCILQCTGQHPQQRIFWNKMSMVLRLRNTSLVKVGEKGFGGNFWLWLDLRLLMDIQVDTLNMGCMNRSANSKENLCLGIKIWKLIAYRQYMKISVRLIYDKM